VVEIKCNDGIVLVDDSAYELLAGYNVHTFIANGKPYARFYVKNQPRRYTLLHRFILGAKNGEYVDHINGNTLDNRKCNIRICTQAQNMMNTGYYKNNASGVKGVNFRKDAHKWQAYITANKKWIYLGMYDSKEDAIRARRSGEEKYHGVFSRGAHVL